MYQVSSKLNELNKCFSLQQSEKKQQQQQNV